MWLLIASCVFFSGCAMNETGLVPLPRVNNNSNSNNNDGIENPNARVGALLLGQWNIVNPDTDQQATIVEYTPGDLDTEFICTNLNEDGSLKIDGTGQPIIPATITIQPGGTPRDFEVLDDIFLLRYEFNGEDEYRLFFIDDNGNVIPTARGDRR
jgi:hypothetical protein